MKRWMQVTMIAGFSAMTMGASCFEVTEPLEITINAEDLSSTYNVPAGATTFGEPQSCTTVNASQYADTDAEITNARLTDITIQTVGTFAGNVNNGSVTVNGTPIINYNGPWNTFNTAQSILSSTAIQRNQAGITQLIDAIKNEQNVVICSSGTLSQPATAGLQAIVKVHAQFDVTP